MESYFRSGLALSTQRSYSSAKRRFLLFCEESIIVDRAVIMQIRLSPRGPGSIPQDSKHLSAARHLQISMNLQDPRIREMPKLEQMLGGVKREHAKQSAGQASKAAHYT